MSMAVKMAARIERGSAWSRPAISKAVPWSGEVRTTLSPAVKLTPSSKERALKGESPWSWYIASVASKFSK